MNRTELETVREELADQVDELGADIDDVRAELAQAEARATAKLDDVEPSRLRQMAALITKQRADVDQLRLVLDELVRRREALQARLADTDATLRRLDGDAAREAHNALLAEMERAIFYGARDYVDQLQALAADIKRGHGEHAYAEPASLAAVRALLPTLSSASEQLPGQAAGRHGVTWTDRA